ncbi:MAG TPA: response regulator, partial [Vulgatibacter sp.]|nr:response regulator [Vulgatibacter sp.]
MSPPLILLVDDNKELADLLAQILEEAGYRARTCYRGRSAIDALHRERPAVAVVDLLLPDLVGYEVAKEFKAANVPFILVTGVFKGAKHSFEAKARFGAAGWFEKPFEAGRLLEAIRAIVPPGERPVARKETFDVELDIDVDERDSTPQSPLEMTGRIAVKSSNVQAVLTGTDFALNQPTSGQKIVRTGPSLPSKEQVSPDGRSRRGVLENNLPQLIAAFWQLQETGELGLQRGKVKKVIYFEKGHPVFALSNLAADRFGTFLARVGKITEEQLRAATAAAMAQKRRTGDVLIEMGLLQDAERMY